MADSYALPQDVADLFGPLSTEQTDKVDALLAHASAMLRGRFPGLDARIAAGKVEATGPMYAVIAMVLRVLRNPGGLRSETVGPYSRTFDSSQGTGLLEITPAEVALITAGQGAGRPAGVGTIRVSPGLAWPCEVPRVRRW